MIIQLSPHYRIRLTNRADVPCFVADRLRVPKDAAKLAPQWMPVAWHPRLDQAACDHLLAMIADTEGLDSIEAAEARLTRLCAVFSDALELVAKKAREVA